MEHEHKMEHEHNWSKSFTEIKNGQVIKTYFFCNISNCPNDGWREEEGDTKPESDNLRHLTNSDPASNAL